MNPWFGLVAGPCLAGAGVMILRDPEAWSRTAHAVNRAIYRIAGARYDGGRLDRLIGWSIRLNGVLFIGLGVGLFITGFGSVW